MSEPYIGEIRMFGGNFAPNGWQLCQGQLVPIDLYETLFNLIGTTYGGDGQSTFALPNLASRLPVHQGSSFVLGQTGGVESVTLLSQQLPVHNHPAYATTVTGTSTSPQGGIWAANSGGAYTAAAPGAAMASDALQLTGGNQPHENMPPYLAVNFIISMYGVYPVPS